MLPYIIAGAIGFVVGKLLEEDEAPKYADGGLIAPNGKPSNLTPEQYKLVRSQAFKNWFGDWENDPENASKVVDENGEPLVVWRGESKEFNKFEYKKLGSKLKTAWRKAGFYFSPTKNGAEQYMFFMQSGILKQFFLNIKNPYTFDSKEFFGVMDWGSLPTQRFKTNKSATDYANSKVAIIKNDNFDGFFVTILEKDNVVEIVAFQPKQIKLADGTNTTFDGENPDIRFDGGGLIKQNRDESEKKIGNFFNWFDENDWKEIVNQEDIEKLNLKSIDGYGFNTGIYYQSPNEEILFVFSQWSRIIKDKYGNNTQIYLRYGNTEPVLVLTYLVVKNKGIGIGSKAIKLLTELCDKFGVTIQLEPNPIKNREFFLSSEQLVKFYKKAGFKITYDGDGANKIMEYKP